MTNLSAILAELEKLYPKLVEKYETELSYYVPSRGLSLRVEQPPVITLASKGRKRTQQGWYVPAVWVDSQEDVLASLAGIPADQRKLLVRAEIVLATELLDDPVQTAAELLRQIIVHYSGGRLAGGQGYYPIVWESVAPTFGFTGKVLQDQPSRGWAQFQPIDGDTWAQWVRREMNTGVFDVSRKSDETGPRPGSRMKKWTCGCTVIRSATQVCMVCEICGNRLRWAEKNEISPWDGMPDTGFNLLDWATQLSEELDKARGK